MSPRKRRLGSGVDALLSGKAAEKVPVAADTKTHAGLEQVALDKLQPSPHQPRSRFDAESIAQLAQSLKTHGLIQPIVVRRVGDRLDLVAGERRVRAAREAGLTTLPAIVRTDLDTNAAAELTLIENIQREDLNPMEVARSLKQLVSLLGLSHGEVADRIGRARPTVTNLLRLLELSAAVQRMVEAGDLSMGHARLLVSVAKSKQGPLAQTIVAQGMSVRRAEAYIREQTKPTDDDGPEDTGGGEGTERTEETKRLERKLSDHLGYTATVRRNIRGAGTITLRFSSTQSLQGLLDKFGYSED